MFSSFGERIRMSIFGESHGRAIGVVLEGLPPGEAVDLDELAAFMARRRPGQALATRRREPDQPHILSGLHQGVTTGAPLCAVIENTDTRSGDYRQHERIPRPSHADYPAWVKYRGHNDLRGGGHFSGRLTAPLCAAGGIARQMLSRRGIELGAHLLSVGLIQDDCFDPVNVTRDTLQLPSTRSFPVLNEEKGRLMQDEIHSAAALADSVGGVVECCVTGLPVGLGEPIFGGLENRLAQCLFGIPAMRGLEFGAGFGSAQLRGSQHNDPYILTEDGQVRTVTNHHGGILGGLSTGMPLLFRAAFKPTPSIGQEQTSVDLIDKTAVTMRVHGRHDPCVALRAVPCVEAAAAVTLLDVLILSGQL